MTLRLVNDNREPDDTLYCRHGTSCRNPATILMKFASGTWLPACDQCARRIYESYPHMTEFAPLADYVDLFAAAREAALATPEQVIQARQTWDTGEPIITPAPARPVQAGNGFTAEERAARAARPKTAGPSSRTWWTAGIATLASWALGITLCSESVHMQQSFMTVWGVLFILLPFLGWIIAGLVALSRIPRPYAAQAAAAPQQYQGGSYQPGIPVGQLAMAAAPWVALGVAEHHRHVHHQQALQAVQDNAAAWQSHYAQQRQDATQQAILGQLQQLNDPGPAYGAGYHTPHSDIYGNMT